MALTKVSRGLLSTSIVDNGNATAITIDSSENVGIGTSSPNTGSGTNLSISSDVTTRLLLENTATNGKEWGIYSGSSGVLGFYDYSSSTERMRIDSSGNVGIGTSSPSALLDVSANGSSIMRLSDSSSPATYAEFKQANGVLSFNADAGNAQSSTVMKFLVDNSEAMRIDSSGNLLVAGKTGLSDAGVGHAFGGGSNAGLAYHTVDGTIAMSLNRLTSDGSILRFVKDGTAVGSIGSSFNSGSRYFYISGLSATGVGFYSNGIYPSNGTGGFSDASKDVGSSSVRWRNIYRSGSTYQSSDRTLKQDIRDLTDSEHNVAVACKGLLKAFRFIDAVEKDGDDANIHFGVIAQELAEAFEAEGLDANDYQVYKSATTTDEEGNEQTRLNVCYENLLAFIISAI